MGIQKGNEGLPDSEFGDGVGDGKGRIRPEGFRRGLYRLLVPGRKSPQGVLNPVSQLSQDRVGDVPGTLGHEVHPDPLGTHQTDNLLDLVQKNLRGSVEEKVRFVEEKHELRLIQVTRFGELLEQLRQ